MKRILSILLVFALFIPSLSLAGSEFSICNDIHFGDSRATVKSKESNTLKNEYSNSLQYVFPVDGCEATIEYLFQKDEDILTNIFVQYEYSDSTQMDEHHTALKNSLITALGNPIPEDEKHWKTISGPGLECSVMMIKAYKDISTSTEKYDGNIVNLSEWVVVLNGVPIKIELVSYYLSSYFQNTKATFYNYFNIVGYHKYTPEEEQEDSKVNNAEHITDYKHPSVPAGNMQEITTSSESTSTRDFQLRKSIRFGDSINEIKEKETLSLNSESEDKTRVTYRGSIAGMEGYVVYLFDNDKLTDMVYEFESSSSKDLIDRNYDKLEQSLKQKYGNSLGFTDGKVFAITGRVYSEYATSVAIMSVLGGTYDIRDYDEWIVKTDDYYVKIDLLSFYTFTSKSGYSFSNYISYHYFTEKDLEQYQQKKKDEQSSMDDDL